MGVKQYIGDILEILTSASSAKLYLNIIWRCLFIQYAICNFTFTFLVFKFYGINFPIDLLLYLQRLLASISLNFSAFHYGQVLDRYNSFVSLTHFQPMFHFYTPWEHQKTGVFLMFSRDIEVKHWLKMG